MGRVYGEPVVVQAREDGRPVRFTWRERAYQVLAVEEHWMVNRDWWREPAAVPARPELQFWRVEAVTGQGAHGTYELCSDIAAGNWTLRRIAD